MLAAVCRVDTIELWWCYRAIVCAIAQSTSLSISDSRKVLYSILNRLATNSHQPTAILQSLSTRNWHQHVAVQLLIRDRLRPEAYQPDRWPTVVPWLMGLGYILQQRARRARVANGEYQPGH